MPHRSIKITSPGPKPVHKHDNLQQRKAGAAQTSFGVVLSSALKQAEGMQKSSGKLVLNSAVPAPIIPARFENTPAGDFSNIMKVVLKHEGKAYVRRDGRESSRMGILQSTAREYGYTGDIKNISQADAEAIYKKIWDKSGAANLPYPLSVVHFDTYVNSPSAARKILKQSGGDVDTYLNLRERRFVRLAETRPDRYHKYLKGWINRVNSLRTVVAQYEKIDGDSIIRTASAKRVNTRA